jgi:hypothetical protein
MSKGLSSHDNHQVTLLRYPSLDRFDWYLNCEGMAVYQGINKKSTAPLQNPVFI